MNENTATHNKPQRSEAQREASRRNGALSRGPKTAQGKAASARNSLRHGLSARKLLLDNENPACFGRLLRDLTAAIQPRDDFERAMVYDLAYLRWRQYRTWSTETGTLNAAMTAEDSSAAGLARAYEQQALSALHRAEGRYFRQYRKILSFLEQKKMQNEPDAARCRSIA